MVLYSIPLTLRLDIIPKMHAPNRDVFGFSWYAPLNAHLDKTKTAFESGDVTIIEFSNAIM